MLEARMTRIGKAIFWASPLLAAALVACLGEKVAGGTGVGNPPQGLATMALIADPAGQPQAKSSGRQGSPDTGIPATDAAGTRFLVKRCIAQIGQIRLKLPDGTRCAGTTSGCETDHLRLGGPFVADLMAGSLRPDPGRFAAPVGTYREVELRVEEHKMDMPIQEQELIGSSMFISGTFDYQGRADRPFTIRLDFDEDIRFDSGSMTVRSEGISRLKVQFAVERWLAQTDITGCLAEDRLVLDAQGGLHIDGDNQCGDLENVMKAGIKASGTLDHESPEEEAEDRSE